MLPLKLLSHYSLWSDSHWFLHSGSRCKDVCLCATCDTLGSTRPWSHELIWLLPNHWGICSCFPTLHSCWGILISLTSFQCLCYSFARKSIRNTYKKSETSKNIFFFVDLLSSRCHGLQTEAVLLLRVGKYKILTLITITYSTYAILKDSPLVGLKSWSKWASITWWTQTFHSTLQQKKKEHVKNKYLTEQKK